MPPPQVPKEALWSPKFSHHFSSDPHRSNKREPALKPDQARKVDSSGRAILRPRISRGEKSHVRFHEIPKKKSIRDHHLRQEIVTGSQIGLLRSVQDDRDRMIISPIVI